MADDQPSSNEIGEGGEGPERSDYDETTTAAASVIENTTSALAEDYADDEPIEDYVVNMVVNEQPDGATLSPDLVNAAITDIHGNIISSKTPLIDSINGYSTAVYDQLNGTDTGGKRWWGWSTKKILLIALIALCILGIILAILFLVGKKFKKNKKTTTAGPTTTTKAVVTKGVSPDPKYQPVPNV